MKSIKLEEGEMICPDCNGTCKEKKQPGEGESFFNVCFRCYGSGKIDWVDNICGSRNRIRFENLLNPLKRQIFPTSIISNLVDVQPMEKDVSKVYYLKPVFKKEE